MNKALREELVLLRLQSKELRSNLFALQEKRRKNRNIDNLMELLVSVPATTSLALKATSLPRNLSTKILVGAALLGIAYIRYRSSTPPNP
ncbi:hypothetical protein [Nitrosomonas supralitoralis]|uniref:Uncharacterized protein n=1 Tax=Nitrosomonas supralitoralis TaxID=2116706 RepID=A0A2P7NSC7_9PROT|nr:hypothetical protein [Nitrosomonas supralitoralis]PSJ16372.1 hypothetical protein C7H79_13790 [Nitrosomonas supralitoralis]